MIKNKTILDWIAFVIVIIGALNWGLLGTLGIDMIFYVFGRWIWVARVLYALVGLAGIYLIYAIARPAESSGQQYNIPQPPAPQG